MKSVGFLPQKRGMQNFARRNAVNTTGTQKSTLEAKTPDEPSILDTANEQVGNANIKNLVNERESMSSMAETALAKLNGTKVPLPTSEDLQLKSNLPTSTQDEFGNLGTEMKPMKSSSLKPSIAIDHGPISQVVNDPLVNDAHETIPTVTPDKQFSLFGTDGNPNISSNDPQALRELNSNYKVVHTNLNFGNIGPTSRNPTLVQAGIDRDNEIEDPDDFANVATKYNAKGGKLLRVTPDNGKTTEDRLYDDVINDSRNPNNAPSVDDLPGYRTIPGITQPSTLESDTATPEALPKALPEATPEATPEALPKATPKAIPEAIPEASPNDPLSMMSNESLQEASNAAQQQVTSNEAQSQNESNESNEANTTNESTEANKPNENETQSTTVETDPSATPSSPIDDAVDEDKSKIPGAKYLGKGLKIAGAVPGAIDLFSDLSHTKNGHWDPHFAGDNAAEKVSNGLTIASTVLDFIPGMEWLGALGGVASAGLGAFGNTKDQANLKTKDAAKTVATVHAQLATQTNFHALGMVSNFSNNSMNLIHASSSF